MSHIKMHFWHIYLTSLICLGVYLGKVKKNQHSIWTPIPMDQKGCAPPSGYNRVKQSCLTLENYIIADVYINKRPLIR